jgi:hypothetical protein
MDFLNNFRYFGIFNIFILFMLLSSCKNKEITKEVQEYCECIELQRGNSDSRIDCLDMMEVLKEKYKGDSRALMQILDETEKCR